MRPKVQAFYYLYCGDPQSGKTSVQLHHANQYQRQGWPVTWLAVDEDRIPAAEGVTVAEGLDEAIENVLQYDYSILCIDEAADYLSDDEPLDERIRKIARKRRHVHISLMLSTQIPWDLHRKVRRLYGRCYYFPIDEAGHRFLRRQGVPEDELEVPGQQGDVLSYKVYDKREKTIEAYQYTLDPADWS